MRPHFLFSFRKGNGVEPPKEKRAWGNLPNGFPTPLLTAKGLALGTSGHAVGTAKALELGEIEGAMSSLSIAVAGLMTVIVVPLAANLIK